MVNEEPVLDGVRMNQSHKCICPKCKCGDVWVCMHAGQNPARLPSGEFTVFCKCCVDDSEPPLEEPVAHIARYTIRRS